MTAITGGMNTYDPDFFVSLKKAEHNHFWFDVRRKWILDTLSNFAPPPANVLEIGCGTGYVSSFMASHGYKVVGCEYYKEALGMAWAGFDKIQGSAYELPFADKSFDIVGLFDVVEHFDDELPLLQEARRVLKHGGLLILAVPARDELWSSIDNLSFHKRRYSPEDMNKLLRRSGVNPVSIKYTFMLLYLPMKLLRRKQAREGELLKINQCINTIARLIFDMERIMSRYIKLPIGTSIIAAAKK